MLGDSFHQGRTLFVLHKMLFHVFKDGKCEKDPSELQLKSEQETFIVNRPDSVVSCIKKIY